jgi:hypothetical protein
MSDIYKEGYDKGYEAGRIAGILEVVDWLEYQPRLVESGVVSDVHLRLKMWQEHPEAPFGHLSR